MWGRADTSQQDHHYQISSSVSDIRGSKLSVSSSPPVVEFNKWNMQMKSISSEAVQHAAMMMKMTMWSLYQGAAMLFDNLYLDRII